MGFWGLRSFDSGESSGKSYMQRDMETGSTLGFIGIATGA